MKNYIDLMKDILVNGIDCKDRTGSGRRKVFGRQLRFDLSNGDIPLLTTREVNPKVPIRELLWFIKGETDVTKLGLKIWDLWSVKEEDITDFLKRNNVPEEAFEMLFESYKEQVLNTIGPMYGEVWRRAPARFYNYFFPVIKEEDIAPDRLKEIREKYEEEAPVHEEDGSVIEFEEYLQIAYHKETDQLQELITNLKKNPFSSRLIISGWIPEYIPFEHISPQDNVMMGRGALAPCHVLQQYIVLPPKEEGGKLRLSLMMTQRSADYALGSPTNICQYAIMLRLIAQVVGMDAHEFVYSTGDTHLYLNQIEKAKEHVLREPRPLPKLWLNPDITSIYDFKEDDIKIVDYDPVQPPIVYPISK